MNGAQVAPDVSSSKAADSSNQHHICSRFLKKKPPDIYGQKHVIESSKIVTDSLRLLDKEIKKLPGVGEYTANAILGLVTTNLQ